MPFLSDWFGGKPKAPELVVAEGAFTPEELEAIQKQLQATADPADHLLAHALLHTIAAGCPEAPAAATRPGQPDAGGLTEVSAAQLIVAKAACERSGEDAARAWAHALLCQLCRDAAGCAAAQQLRSMQGVSLQEAVLATSLLALVQPVLGEQPSGLTLPTATAAAPSPTANTATAAAGAAPSPPPPAPHPQLLTYLAMARGAVATACGQQPGSEVWPLGGTDHQAAALPGAQGQLLLTPGTARGSGAGAGAGVGVGVGGTVREVLSMAGYRRWVLACPLVHSLLTGWLSGLGQPPATAPTEKRPQPGASRAEQAGSAAAAFTHWPLRVSAGGSAVGSGSGASGSGEGAATCPAPQAARPWQLPPAIRDMMPQLLVPGRPPGVPLLLQPPAALMLAGCVGKSMRREWRLLFHSQRDGKSFSTLMARLAAAPGPSLLLLTIALMMAHGSMLSYTLGYFHLQMQETVAPPPQPSSTSDPSHPTDPEVVQGAMPLPRHVLGGFAPAPWAKSGTFFGDHSAFVFRLEPELQVFNATGINTNFQWCGVGNSQLVNGLGFGGAQGAAGQFGLLLDVSMDRGMSRPIATFGSPCLASQQLFQVGVVEAWLLQAPEEEDVPATTTNGTVMDRMASDRAFMSLAGVGTDHSAGLRQQRPEDDL
ncbi:hypothetical protein QJQ45_016193 [Haematococcus lacustris]|nr:hypothetical protein QJQ45_016193 [Haematococcus lacustris]